MVKQVIAEYNEAIVDTDRDRALKVIHAAEMTGSSREDIVFKVVLPAIDLMIKSISENYDANLAQHFMTAQIADAVTSENIAKFRLAPEITGRVVIGTTYGNLHSLGKRIVTGGLMVRMGDVKDLGLNVTPERFVDAAIVHNAECIGSSAMMVYTAEGENRCTQSARNPRICLAGDGHEKMGGLR